MRTWLKFRVQYLWAVLRGEGRGSERLYGTTCRDCKSAAPEYRCRDQACLGGNLYCSDCMVKRHQALPLHWMEFWNGACFERTSLREMGLVVQLGHSPGSRCQFREHRVQKFVLLHVNGIHELRLDFCNCGVNVEHREQLLRACWWPATPLAPETGATFEVLRQFQNLNCLGKVSGYDYYRTLELLTDNTGTIAVPDRRRSFMRMVRQWRNIKMFKRAGRGHAASGIDGTEDGELALLCRACPQPEINLPENWREEPAPTAFKYAAHLGADANYRLSERNVSSEARDPTLAQGKAYFVNRLPYMEHIKNYVTQEDINTCSGFQAMFLANLKRINGLRTSGVGGVTCTRHNMWRPNGLGDLQKGERFCNMDWILFSSLQHYDILRLYLTYDIACQYFKKFWDRMRSLPEYLHLNIPPADVYFAVPNFHLPAHRMECYAPFSLHFMEGVGLTNGEGIEQNWENSNGAARQTKEMGPGSRQDTLDDIFGAHNYRKTLALGRILQKRMVEGIKEAVRHRDGFDGFHAGLEGAEPGITADWDACEAAWQADRTKLCPYETTHVGKTMKDVELELAKEEFEETESRVQVVHQSSRSQFIVMGLEVEETQRLLELDIRTRKRASTYQELDFVKRRTTLLKKIERFRKIQDVYMPGLRDELTAEQRAAFDGESRKEPETTRMFLPSALSEAARKRACAPGIPNVEARYRHAEASETLETIRSGLRMRTVTNRFKVKNITGQRANTRAQGIQHQVDVRIHGGKVRYRYAREAYLRLTGPGPWEEELRVLKDEDVRALNERAMTAEEAENADRLRAAGHLNEVEDGGVASEGVIVMRGEGHRTLSWIWYYGGARAVGDREQKAQINEALRAEWCKARARARRWREELILLEEEMRRTVEFGLWRAAWWREQTGAEPPSEEVGEGLAAFAEECARTELKRAEGLERKWAPVREKASRALAGLDGGSLIEIHLTQEEIADVDDEGEAAMHEGRDEDEAAEEG
ncbi:hypothetical protein B0H11DRAFT_1768213 [Mycena galericulata]|nr:hypothetical protein B0H11DRAFT_1768213 [Mycena galericulata]